MNIRTEAQHEALVTMLVKPPDEIIAETTPNKADLTHMALGVAGEAGELVDAIKKHTIYGKPIDRANVIEELGDLEFYLRHIRTILGITREETLSANIEKLTKRYGWKYSNEAAITRVDKQESSGA